jgi:hypothetical protein
MDTVAVNVRRIEKSEQSASAELEQDLERVRLLAKWLDARFEIMGIPFGLDALIGLIPVVGDTVTSIIAGYPILLAQKHGLGKAVQARMAANVAVDWLVGLVPAVGDVFDVAYKANLKNVKLFEQAVQKKRRELAHSNEKPLVG